jgi:hypothetical protein
MQCIFKNKKQIQIHTNTPSIIRNDIYMVCMFCFYIYFLFNIQIPPNESIQNLKWMTQAQFIVFKNGLGHSIDFWTS